MKKRFGFLVILSSMIFLLTACPKESEVRQMMADHVQKRNEAVVVLSKQDYSLDGLLKAHDYFFSFSEKVHMMIVDEEGRKNIRRLIKKNGAQSFCANYVISTAYWTPLEAYCSSSATYKCSPEIKEYKNTLRKFREMAGEYADDLAEQPGCR